MDIMDRARVLHAAKRIVKVEQLFNEEVDELLDALGLTREEVLNETGPTNKEVDTVGT